MTTYQWLLGLHVVAAALFLGGAVAGGILHTAALLGERPSEIAALLGRTRIAVVIVTVGALGSLAFGLALVAHLPYRSVTDPWVTASLALWVVSLILGGAGGRPARKARHLAERLAREGDTPSGELRRALADPVVFVLNYTSFIAAIAILALMIWKPS